MLSQLEQACKTYSTESSSGLVEFDSNWQRIFVTGLTFRLDQAILRYRPKLKLSIMLPSTIKIFLSYRVMLWKLNVDACPTATDVSSFL